MAFTGGNSQQVHNLTANTLIQADCSRNHTIHRWQLSHHKVAA